MNKIEDIRTNNLITLISKYGGQTKFAQKIDRSPQQVNQWLRHSINTRSGKPTYIGPSSCRMIEKALKLPDRWLDQPHQKETIATIDATAGDAVISVDAPSRSVPIYERPEWNSVHEKGNPVGWIVCPVSCGENTYAMTVRDNSMKSPNGRSFLTGDIVYIDPDEDEENGDFVFATSSHYKMASIKQYIIQEEKKYLYTSNPSWQRQWIEIDETIKLHGVVIASMRSIR